VQIPFCFVLIEDRGLDNWMIKICWHNHEDDDAQSHGNVMDPGAPNANGRNGHHPTTVKPVTDQPVQSTSLVDIRPSDTLGSRTSTAPPGTSNKTSPHIHIGAIDNSLAFPWKHPDEWRSFPLYTKILRDI
jgi:phosphatidylinositol 4-kinase type 2